MICMGYIDLKVGYDKLTMYDLAESMDNAQQWKGKVKGEKVTVYVQGSCPCIQL